MNLKSAFLAAVLACNPVFSQASTVSQPLTVDGLWNEFLFDLNNTVGLGSGFLSTDKTAFSLVSFTFSLTDAAYLQITDAFRDGDRFEVFANGVLLGATSAASATGTDLRDDYTAAFFDDRFSSAQWLLAPGDYAITGNVIQQPEIEGRAALRLSSVPVPASVLFLLTGALGLVGVSKLRRLSKGA